MGILFSLCIKQFGLERVKVNQTDNKKLVGLGWPFLMVVTAIQRKVMSVDGLRQPFTDLARKNELPDIV